MMRFLVPTLLLSAAVAATAQSLNPAEQEAAYEALKAISPGTDWRSLYPDDLCLSGPHSIVCDYFDGGGGGGDGRGSVHITELYFGPLSDYFDNALCSSESTLALQFGSLPFLRKLFFYRCFTGRRVTIPGHFWNSSYLEELHFVENPSLVGKISGRIGSFRFLRRLVFSGTGLWGMIPYSVGSLTKLEQLVMARSQLLGEIPSSVGNLINLKILDLSFNRLDGSIPSNLGFLPNLLKLDLSFNQISGRIPIELVGLQSLEFMDVSHNRFSNSGIPLFMAEMPCLKEVYLSGNPLGGQIPEIWAKLGSMQGLGLSRLGLVGAIPASMGLFLKNACYIGLDNNHLEGSVPSELAGLESLKEMNLENNRLSGRLRFPRSFYARVKLAGNEDLCVELLAAEGGGGRFPGGKLCGKKMVVPEAAAVAFLSSSSSSPALVCGHGSALKCFLLLLGLFAFALTSLKFLCAAS